MIGLLATVSVASAQNIGPVLHFPLNDGSNEWALQVGNCPGSGARTDQAGFSVESGTARYVVRDPNKLTLNQWHHIAGVREGESPRLYVDGVFTAEDRSQPCNSVINDTGLALHVARNQATSTLPATNAVFDEVHIYPFALDDGDVTVAQPAGGEKVRRSRATDAP